MGDRNHGMAGGVVALALVLSPAMAWAACPVQAPRTPKAELGGTAGQCAKLRPTRLRCSGDLPRRATTTQGPRIEVAKTGAVVACVTAPKPRMVAAEARWSAPSEVIHPVSWSEDHFGWNERWQGSGTSRKRSSPSCGR